MIIFTQILTNICAKFGFWFWIIIMRCVSIQRIPKVDRNNTQIIPDIETYF